MLGLLTSIIAIVIGFSWFLALIGIYFILIFVDSLFKNKNSGVATLSVFSTLIQFLGYGLGFLRSFFRISVLKKSMQETFPRMFS